MRYLSFILICTLVWVCIGCQNKSKKNNDNEFSFTDEIVEEREEESTEDLTPIETKVDNSSREFHDYEGNWMGDDSNSIMNVKFKEDNSRPEWQFEIIYEGVNTPALKFHANIDNYKGGQDYITMKIGSLSFEGLIKDNGRAEIQSADMGNLLNILNKGNFDIIIMDKDSKEIYKSHVTNETHNAIDSWNQLQHMIELRKRYYGE
ncbi:MAG: hypothetical protein K2G11_02595 [Muribaculaceae bacterium]|nr:hypothetical protein [Muribaculaceae bacterium]